MINKWAYIEEITIKVALRKTQKIPQNINIASAPFKSSRGKITSKLLKL